MPARHFPLCWAGQQQISKHSPIAPSQGCLFFSLFNGGKLNLLNCYKPARSATVTIIPHGHAGVLSEPTPTRSARRASPTMRAGRAAADFLRAKHHLTGMAGCQATRRLISSSQFGKMHLLRDGEEQENRPKCSDVKFCRYREQAMRKHIPNKDKLLPNTMCKYSQNPYLTRKGNNFLPATFCSLLL